MAYLGMLSLFKILQDGSCGDNSRLQMVHTKTLQVLNVEVSQQFLFRGLLSKHPVIELESEVLRSKETLEVLFAASVKQYLLGRKIT